MKQPEAEGTATVHPYLTFPGNCREAMEFYRSCLGGELRFQKVGEFPRGKALPDVMKEYILHAELHTGRMVIYASDMVEESGLRNGNAVSMMLICGSQKELRAYHKKLSKEGVQTHALKLSAYKVLCGGLIDKYGNSWILTTVAGRG